MRFLLKFLSLIFSTSALALSSLAYAGGVLYCDAEDENLVFSAKGGTYSADIWLETINLEVKHSEEVFSTNGGAKIKSEVLAFKDTIILQVEIGDWINNANNSYLLKARLSETGAEDPNTWVGSYKLRPYGKPHYGAADGRGDSVGIITCYEYF